MNGRRGKQHRRRRIGVERLEDRRLLAAIYGQKFLDADADGFRLDVEEGVDGIVIELVDLEGTVVDTATTNSRDLDGTAGIDPATEQGLYAFEDVADGIYQVREVLDSANQTFPVANGSYIVEVSNGQDVGGFPTDATIHCSLNLQGPGSENGWIGACPEGGTDQYFATATLDLDIPDSGAFDGVSDESILLSGPVTVARGTPVDNFGRPEFETEIVSLELVGQSVALGTIRMRAGDGTGNFSDDGPLFSPGVVRQQLSTFGAHLFSPTVAFDVLDTGQTLTSVGAIQLQGLLLQYLPYFQGLEFDSNGAAPVSLNDPTDAEAARILSMRLTPQYGVDFGNGSATASNFDFGDAPDPGYQTLLPQGPSHELGSNIRLGTTVDGEADGQPNAMASGDDDNGSDDEDGVTVNGTIVAMPDSETTAAFIVNVSAPSRLDAWVDFNANGQFEHPGEHLAGGNSITVLDGDNTVAFQVPAGASVGNTFARFRVSSQGGLSPGGPAADGEVEDHPIEIVGGGVSSNPVLDVTGSGSPSPFQDGILVVRYMLGQPDANLEDERLIPSGATRMTGAEIRAHLDAAGLALDANGDGTNNPFQDGILIVRYLLGQPDANLEDSRLLPDGSTRTTGADIRAYLDSLMPDSGEGELIAPPDRLDIDQDGSITLDDAASVLDAISQPLDPKFDVNDDGRVTAVDALIVINHRDDVAVADKKTKASAVDQLLSEDDLVQSLF